MRRQYFFMAAWSYEDQWYHHSQGYLDEQLFRAYQQHLRVTIGLENYPDLWDEATAMGFFHPDFVDYVEEFLRQNPPLGASWVR